MCSLQQPSKWFLNLFDILWGETKTSRAHLLSPAAVLGTGERVISLWKTQFPLHGYCRSTYNLRLGIKVPRQLMRTEMTLDHRLYPVNQSRFAVPEQEAWGQAEWPRALRWVSKLPRQCREASAAVGIPSSLHWLHEVSLYRMNWHSALSEPTERAPWEGFWTALYSSNPDWDSRSWVHY